MSTRPFRRGDKLRFLYRAWRYRWYVEPGEISFVLDHVSPGQTCLDIGGHKGAFTYWLQRQVGSTGMVYTFEPQPELVRYLEEAKQSLDWHNVAIVPAAVSRSAGTCQLFRPASTPSPGATVEPGIHSCSLTVPMVSLDEYLREHQVRRPIRFVKCDVEGHEMDVFRGAESILREDRPQLLFECEQHHNVERQMDEVFNYLAYLGYSGHFFQNGRLRELADFAAAQKDLGQRGYVRDFVFLPRSSARTSAEAA